MLTPSAAVFDSSGGDLLLDLRHDRSRDRIADMRYVRPFCDAERPVQESDVTSAAQVVQQAGSEDNARSRRIRPPNRVARVTL
jgi:hypothetical protein